MKTSLSLLMVVGTALVSFTACGTQTNGTCEETLSCGGTDGGGDVVIGTDGGGDVVQPPAGCDPAAEPKDAPKCVVNDFGVFVDATNGSETNAGTKESPVKSITAALTKLGGKSRVYICEGTYAEHVKVTSAVSVYAGFACGGWSYSGVKAKVAPMDRGLALELRGASEPVVLSDLELTAKDATEPGESSIGAFVANSVKVTFRRSALTAGKGVDGIGAVAAADLVPANAVDGTAGVAGGAATPNPLCPTSIGGAGGKDGATSGVAGVVAVPVYPAGNTGVGGAGGANCSAGGGGTDGSYGIAGAPGVGAVSVGALDVTGWKGVDGTPGGAGGNGQGGGGGAQRNATGVGGSGGPGGCGGAGGGKGTAGGSSIALLVFESAASLEQSPLIAKDAGRGGNAAKGQKAQLGNINPANGTGANACAGGFGGIGGSGGGGGGGAGGLSVGVLFKGTSPSVDGVSTAAADTLPLVMLGSKGAAGQKGGGGDSAQASAPVSRAGQDGTDGASGDAKAVMSAP